MLSAESKIVSKTTTVLALKKLPFKWRAQTRYLAMVTQSDAFLIGDYTNLGYWVTSSYTA